MGVNTCGKSLMKNKCYKFLKQSSAIYVLYYIKGIRKNGVAVVNCKEASMLIHELLDGSLQYADQNSLKQHLAECNACAEFFHKMEKTEAFVRHLQPVESPVDLKQRIMGAIPQTRQKQRSRSLRWIRRHPALTAAVLLILVMSASMIMMRHQTQELVIKVNDLESIVIEGNHVIVPEDSIVYGNITVENGVLDVRGEVRGDLLVVDGSILQASTANVSGKITSVNQAIDWIWYKVSDWFNW